MDIVRNGHDIRVVARSHEPYGLRRLHRSCDVCDDDGAPSELMSLECGGLQCISCLEAQFWLALRDETLFPPSCCESAIPLRLVRKWLSKALVRDVEARCHELKTKNPTYCHKPACSAFIAHQSTHNDQAICQKCNAKTCTKCKAAWHFGPCSIELDQDEKALLDLAMSEKWQRCPRCRRVIERIAGCPHIR